MATIPKAGVRPPGFVEDPNHQEYTGYKLVIVASVCLGLSTVFVSMRLFVRLFIRTFFGLDDWLIVFAWICGATLAIADIIQCHYGTGSHLWDLPIPTFEVFLKLQMVVGCFYTATLPFAKISICILYLRLAPGEKGLFQIVTKGIIIFVVCFSISGALVIIFSCTPVNASWDLTSAAAPGTRCVNRPKLYFAQSGFNIASDLAIIFAPQLTIWKLNMPLRQRISLMAIFAIGLFITIISIIRLRSLATLLKSPDLTWDTSNVLIWSTLEAHITIICACAPTLKPLLMSVIPDFFRSSHSSDPILHPYIARNSQQRPQKLSDNLTEGMEFENVGRAKGIGNVTDVEIGAFAANETSSQENILDSNVYITKTVNIFRT